MFAMRRDQINDTCLNAWLVECPFRPEARGGGWMASGDLLMSSPGWGRPHVICQTQEGGLSQRAASERLGIGVRQVKRLVAAVEAA